MTGPSGKATDDAGRSDTPRAAGTSTRVTISVAVIGAIGAIIAALIGVYGQGDSPRSEQGESSATASTPSPVPPEPLVVITGVSLSPPGGLPKVIVVRGQARAGATVRCYAEPFDHGPVLDTDPSAGDRSSSAEPGTRDEAQVQFWYVSEEAIADAAGLWEALVVIADAEQRALDVRAAIESSVAPSPADDHRGGSPGLVPHGGAGPEPPVAGDQPPAAPGPVGAPTERATPSPYDPAVDGPRSGRPTSPPTRVTP